MDFSYFDYMDEDKPEYDFTQSEMNMLDCFEKATRVGQYAYNATCAAMDMFKDVSEIENNETLNVLTDALPEIVGLFAALVGNTSELYLAYTTLNAKPESERLKFITYVEENILTSNAKFDDIIEGIREAFPADDGPENLDRREGKV